MAPGLEDRAEWQPAGNEGSARRDDWRNRPRTWRRRYDLVLRLHVAGNCTAEIAAKLRYSPHRVSMIINSPLFQARKTALLHQLERGDHHNLLDEIRREAIPTVEFLCTLRDDLTLPATIRLKAARAIAEQIDRVLPRGGYNT